MVLAVNNNNSNVAAIWNQQVQTDRTIPKNKPDILIRGSVKGAYMPMDVVISGGTNVTKREAKKILKYKRP